MNVHSNLTPDKRRWLQIRKMGMSQYVWLYGVFGWGGATGLLWSIVMTIATGIEHFAFLLIVAMIFFPVSGYCWGILTWWSAEQRYQDQALIPIVQDEEEWN